METKLSSSDSLLLSGHRERLRKKFARDASLLSDAEIVELALGYVYVRRDNSLLARRLLASMGSISQLMRASLAQLEQIDGCGAPVERLFSIIKELNARSLSDECHHSGPLSLAEIAQMAKARLSPCKREELWCVLLDRQNAMLALQKIRSGMADHVLVEPIEIVELMLRFNACSVVLMHNHPGGSYEPSLEDRMVTEKIAAALVPLGLRLHEHLIVAGSKCRCVLQNIVL